MKYKKTAISALLGSSLLCAALPAVATPSGAMLANTCAGCHGLNGESQGPASPNLAGISASYMVDTMKAFQSDARYSTIMGRIARGYSEEELEAMADHFAGMPVYKAKQTTDATLTAKGQGLYEDNCEKCHEDAGASPDDEAGLLAGQWLPYLQFTMEDFISGKREQPKKMKQKVEKLSESDLQALLHFFASQQ